MGRVFDALRKSSSTEKSTTKKYNHRCPQRRDGSPENHGLPSASQIEEQLFSGSSIMSARHETARKFSVLCVTLWMYPTGRHSPAELLRVMLGQPWTLPGAARAGGFVSYDISPARVEPHLVAVSQPCSPYCEQFRSLRTKILQAGERLQQRAFVVTSAGVAEGKTLTALNLAWLLAQAEGVRALIVDSDLRQPCATDYLGIENPVGLSEVLGGQVRVEDAIVRLNPAGLYLLPGGRQRDDVAELLSGPSYARLLNDLRKMFDYIIIDAPPLGIFTDASVLMIWS